MIQWFRWSVLIDPNAACHFDYTDFSRSRTQFAYGNVLEFWLKTLLAPLFGWSIYYNLIRCINKLPFGFDGIKLFYTHARLLLRHRLLSHAKRHLSHLICHRTCAILLYLFNKVSVSLRPVRRQGARIQSCSCHERFNLPHSRQELTRSEHLPALHTHTTCVSIIVCGYVKCSLTTQSSFSRFHILFRSFGE